MPELGWLGIDIRQRTKASLITREKVYGRATQKKNAQYCIHRPSSQTQAVVDRSHDGGANKRASDGGGQRQPSRLKPLDEEHVQLLGEVRPVGQRPRVGEHNLRPHAHHSHHGQPRVLHLGGAQLVHSLRRGHCEPKWVEEAARVEPRVGVLRVGAGRAQQLDAAHEHQLRGHHNAYVCRVVPLQHRQVVDVHEDAALLDHRPRRLVPRAHAQRLGCHAAHNGKHRPTAVKHLHLAQILDSRATVRLVVVPGRQPQPLPFAVLLGEPRRVKANVARQRAVQLKWRLEQRQPRRAAIGGHAATARCQARRAQHGPYVLLRHAHAGALVAQVQNEPEADVVPRDGKHAQREANQRDAT
mmetsp:Transcript_9731/g.30482  ORF Transcript_9731/g.30482 Transcript_9731/m.30482 type:complete len:356 (-) Transcript_9731:1379-2446(-)